MLLQTLYKSELLLQTEDCKWSTSSRMYDISFTKFQIYNQGLGWGEETHLKKRHNLQIFKVSYLHDYKFSSTCFLSALNVITCITFHVFKEMFQFLKCWNSTVTLSNSTCQIPFFPILWFKKKIM